MGKAAMPAGRLYGVPLSVVTILYKNVDFALDFLCMYFTI